MAHGILGRGAMPVLDTRSRPDDVARLDLNLLPAFLLNPAGAGSDDEGLSSRMRVPV
jgi:hypothetical protein